MPDFANRLFSSDGFMPFHEAIAIPAVEELANTHEDLRRAHEVLESRVQEERSSL